MVRIPTHRAPTHPGEMLREEFLKPMGLSQKELAAGIHVPYQRINELVRGRRGVTPSTALRLARFFGMSPDFWLSLQLRWDLYHAQQSEAPTLRAIRQIKRSRRAA
ncbi:XRE family transcriptional regulator [Candidatus Methylomirabilis lanthanidiphila]|uniref:XRE family transcriptional regulator n=1 Tax=Candidatus Methylomirabilis lanthanidiphila TaxID=2211376 RepID=A0A564ZND1_9BACT|nr:HigA family addiction module antidote protein [Candidatus Methylomirabilis lanthanidiphila]VUZ86367.1 XRE family transcriptional regulator [Candidatus Methylomirabilis lanthanidiphila]